METPKETKVQNLDASNKKLQSDKEISISESFCTCKKEECGKCVKKLYQMRLNTLQYDNHRLREDLNYVLSQLPKFQMKVTYENQPSVALFEGTELIPYSNLYSPAYNSILLDWLGVGKGIIELNLVYRASRDGFKYEKFRKCCWHQGPPFLLLCQSKETHCVFGGYSTAVLGDKSHKTGDDPISIFDKNAFLFNFELKKRFIIKDPELTNSQENIHSGKWMIAFGNNDMPDLGISIEPQKGPTSECHFSNLFIDSEHVDKVPTGEHFEKLTGNKNFTVEEIEIFFVEVPSHS